MALLAVGGYGRAELAPQSDIDVLLLHTGVKDIGAIAEAIWYPIWDEGLKLGHSVRTPKEALALAADDLDTATSLVTVRHLAGDASLSADLADRALALWRKRARRWLAEISTRVRTRQAEAGEVAFLLEPDLKEGRGGLRDVHAIRWAELAQTVMLEGDDATLEANNDVLLDARVELHRITKRPGDRLLLEEQDEVADRARLPRRRRADAGGQHRGPLDRVDERRGLGAGRLVAEGTPRLADGPRPVARPGGGAARGPGVPHRRGRRHDRPAAAAPGGGRRGRGRPAHRAAHARSSGRHRARSADAVVGRGPGAVHAPAAGRADRPST